MGGTQTEACGRCGMTAVLEASDGGRLRRVLGARHIEVPEERFRFYLRHNHALGRVKEQLNDAGMARAYGRMR